MNPPLSIRCLRSRRTRAAGFSLLEAVVATVIVGIVTSAIYAMNGAAMTLVKTTWRVNAASLTIQNRVEQIRIANYLQVTSTEFLSGTYFSPAKTPPAANYLPACRERIVITPYDPADTSGADPFLSSTFRAQGKVIEVVRSGSSTSVLATSGSLESEENIRVNIEVGWKDVNRPMVRQSSVILAKGGISRQNILLSQFNQGVAPPTTSGTAVAVSGTGGTTTGSTGSTGNGQGNGNAGNGNNGNGRGNTNGTPGNG